MEMMMMKKRCKTQQDAYNKLCSIGKYHTPSQDNECIPDQQRRFEEEEEEEEEQR